ncbi:MAG: hypothetical protein K2L88_06560 [Clostridiales bacterium]|nr:hypothetical protein [Clostridiales bacterium]
MTYQQVYKSHHARIVREGVLKAAIFSSIIGLAVAAVIAFATIFTEFNGLWTAIGVGLGVAAVMIPILYFTVFRPTEKSVAESLDRLGFDERVITMLELEGDNSVMAELQRNDAITTLTAVAENHGGKIPIKALPFMQKLAAVGLGTKMLVTTGAVAAVAATTLTLTAMPTQRVKEIFMGTNSYTISYNAGGHGYITTESGGYEYDAELARVGKYSVKVDEGKMSERITITANDGIDDEYVFVGWSDDYSDEYNAASRTDKALMGIIATAQYEMLNSVKDDDINGENPMMFYPCDAPYPPGGGSNDEGNTPPNSENNFENLFPPKMDENTTSGGSPISSEVIDGKTDYQEYFQQHYEEAMQRLSEGKDIPETLRKLIAAYFTSLQS